MLLTFLLGIALLSYGILRSNTGFADRFVRVAFIVSGVLLALVAVTSPA